MKIFTEEIPGIVTENIKYPVEHLCSDISKILFIDIETTGFSPRSSQLYMVGSVFYKEGKWYTRQWFADEVSAEKEVIEAAMEFAKEFELLIHFNGNRFDLPYLKYKCEKSGMTDTLDKIRAIDIYKCISPYKSALKLEDCKQKSIEKFLGIKRDDKYDGGQLIAVYKDYLKDKDADLLKLLILHNIEDLRGMLSLLKMMSYYDFFESIKNIPTCTFNDGEASNKDINLPVRAVKVGANYYNDHHGNRRQEVVMNLSIEADLPVEIKMNYEGMHFKAEGNSAMLRVPLLESELKYYYANYKDYFYLPGEDQALHKSIAAFVDKARRTQATAATCYTRKFSQYLREWDLIFTPFFKKDYHDKELYFELDDNIKRSRLAMSLYAAHIISVMAD